MAKQVKMFILEGCPYCKEAFKIMDALNAENPEFKNVDIEIIEETQKPDIAAQYDYEYVPTYFVDEKKVHEGVPSTDAVKRVFEEALS